MPRIKNINADVSLTGDDKLLGSDAASGETRNYTLNDIANFVSTSSDSQHRHHQNNAATTWTITHNLDLTDYLPIVNMKLSGGGVFNNVQAMGVVTYINKNELTISLATAASGYAYLKK